MTTIDESRPTIVSAALLTAGDSFRVFGRVFTALDYPTGDTEIHVRDHENRIDILLHIPAGVRVKILEAPARDRTDLEDVRRMDILRITRHDGTSFTGVVCGTTDQTVTIAQKFRPNTTIGRNAIAALEILNR